MTFEELEANVRGILDYQDSSVDAFDSFMQGLQDAIYAMLILKVLGFDTSAGKVTTGRSFNRQISEIENEINTILSTAAYEIELQRLLNSHQSLKDRIINSHERYSNITVRKTNIDPVILQIQRLSTNNLSPKKGVQQNVVEPLKMLLVQQATTGQTVEKMLKALQNWHQGEYAHGRAVLYAQDTPSLSYYANRIAMDSGTLVMRTVNEIVKQDNVMDGFAYVGGIIRDSRPLCKYLVSQKRHFKLTEVPPLIRKYPDGLYPNTTMANFCQNCGGYNCRHMAFPVIVDEDV